MNATSQLAFNHLHIDCIVRDKRFRDWDELSKAERTVIIDHAEKLAEAEFVKN